MSDKVDIVVDAPTLCNYFGISNRQLANYRKDGLPMDRPNKYNVREAFEWYVNSQVQKALRSNKKPALRDEESLKLRKLEAEATAKEIEVQQALGSLVRIEDADKELRYHMTNVKNGLMSFPARVAPFVIGLEEERVARDVLDREVAALLDRLKEQEENRPVESDVEDEDEVENEDE